ncbi:MAG: hypothetical protein PHW40_01620 [Candidatus Izemoplasmatales bacterium]|nr:hypothetical protein [Candidatus Izemoplasmatales bacterium]MDD5292994.1 hypothetical protein [Candidatus Izemoplasmatales bacterium]
MTPEEKTVHHLWRWMGEGRWDQIAELFSENAKIYWPNTEEAFDVSTYIRINQHYPGTWLLTEMDIQTCDRDVVSVVKIEGENAVLFAISFFTFKAGKIITIREYFAENTPIPDWRKKDQ